MHLANKCQNGGTPSAREPRGIRVVVVPRVASAVAIEKIMEASAQEIVITIFKEKTSAELKCTYYMWEGEDN